ncbi:cupin domain-containing protein [Parvibaculum sp.]|uniref:cupin domain-containing protein n=1 Tax=Parvibaculum sp. TaxID=2024848 RepID=UPI001B10D273|nr:cupin domain-containing protein [Parvibaculum sp.]MBO6666590.1 cupin domain-containing protein [Parvibaculum sp.]MBO6692319.1 cupin domain-containing protein [Parvibaculum sp.]MBO6713211.1 cupin domain-containing protein [Parvibaculum sp.]
MKVNDDFEARAAVHARDIDWVPSPVAGVDRKMFDRVGGEVARATSIVRYAPGSLFSPHVHGGGEEFVVLDGVFQDEHGNYPAGSYVRNPPTSRHRPGSGPGCTIFVKLWQFDPEDRTQVRLDLFDPAPEAVPERPGVEMRAIFQDSRECVSSAFWHPGASIFRRNGGGMELLCLKGSFTEGGETFSTWSWLRLPPGTALQAEAGPEGAFLWMKEGHLRFVEKELAALEAAAS